MRTAANLFIAIFMLTLTFSPALRLKLMEAVVMKLVEKKKFIAKHGVLYGHRKLMDKGREERKWLFEPVPPEKLASSLKGIGPTGNLKRGADPQL